jgi:hypothetical protein
MVEYFRTTARRSMPAGRLLQIAVALAFFSLFTSVSAFAQNGAGRSNNAQAVLHIRINIVPVVMAVPPPTEPYRPLGGAVTYNIPGSKSNVEIIEETRPFSTHTSGQGSALRTTTIVLR